jgi:hypothetical protein
LDKRIRQATSGEARRIILQGTKKNKLVALLVEKLRCSEEAEDIIQQFINESTEKTKRKIVEDFTKNVSLRGVYPT